MTITQNLEFYIFFLTNIDARYLRKDIEISSEDMQIYMCCIVTYFYTLSSNNSPPCNSCLTNLKDTLEEEELGHLKSLEGMFK